MRVFDTGVLYFHSSTIITSSRMRGNVRSGDGRVDLKLVTSINSKNKSASVAVQIACFNYSDQNYRGRMEIVHSLAPAVMINFYNQLR